MKHILVLLRQNYSRNNYEYPADISSALAADSAGQVVIIANWVT